MERQELQNKQQEGLLRQVEPAVRNDHQPPPQTDSLIKQPTTAPAIQPGLRPQQIHFPDGQQAQLIIPPPGTEAKEILSALSLEPPDVLFLIIGGANDKGENYLAPPPILPKKLKTTAPLKAVSPLDLLYQPSAPANKATPEAYLTQLFSRGIARAAANSKAMIIDGGRQTGIMAMMGQGVADRGRQTSLIGLAPAGKVTYPGGPAPSSQDNELLDPNHTHFILTEGEQWGDETEMLYHLAAALAGGEEAENKLVITILVNGGSVAKKQLLLSVRAGWPVIIIQGSGHLADEIAGWWQSKATFIPDPGLAEIVADGKLHFLPLTDSIDKIGWLIEQLLRQHRINRNLSGREPAELIPQQLPFANRRQALLVIPASETAPETMIQALGLAHPVPVLLLLGGSPPLAEALSTFGFVSDPNPAPLTKDGQSEHRPESASKNSTRQANPSPNLLDNIYEVLIDPETAGGTPSGQIMTVDMLARLAQLFRLGIGPAAAQTGVTIIDGGRQTGIMALMGQSVADRGRQTTLIGLAPAGRVTYPGGPAPGSLKEGEPLDPNHTHFVLTEGEQWGDETETMVRLATALARQETEGKIKPGGKPASLKSKLVAVILINGNAVTKKQLVRSVQSGWPIIVVKGSGDLADEIARLWQEKPAFIPDSDMAEIISYGKVHLFDLERPAADFKLQIEQLLNEQLLRHHQSDMTSVEQAWQTFATYDAAAARQQEIFRRLQFWILALGVIGTALALTETTLDSITTAGAGVYPFLAPFLTYLKAFDHILYYLILAIPIIITGLAAVANDFSAGQKWILLRAVAESIKKEIYRYRAKVEIYNDRETKRISREKKLAQRINAITDNLIKGETKLAALAPYKGVVPPPNVIHQEDDGLSFFTPDRYLPLRLEDQYNWYKRKTIKLEKRWQRLKWLIYIIGGAGTLLAAVGLELWIALTTALVTAFATYLEYRQVETTLIRYNRTALNLHQIMMWWESLPVEEQADPRNVDKLVGRTETTIHSEHAAWVQEMQDVIDDLSVQQSQESKRPKSDKKEKMTPEETADLLKLFEGEEVSEQEVSEEEAEEVSDIIEENDQAESPVTPRPRRAPKSEITKAGQ